MDGPRLAKNKKFKFTHFNLTIKIKAAGRCHPLANNETKFWGIFLEGKGKKKKNKTEEEECRDVLDFIS
jgi:hypothetical protein